MDLLHVRATERARLCRDEPVVAVAEALRFSGLMMRRLVLSARTRFGH